MRRFPVDALPAAIGDQVVLGAEASHHLLRVCRHPRGSELVVFDGSGQQGRARLAEVTADDRAVIELVEAPSHAAPRRETWVVLAVLKGPAMERALRMGTEAGATGFQPVLSDRTVAKGDRHDRWLRVLTGAAQQCGRADVPELRPVRSLADGLSALPPGLTRFVAAPGAAPAPTRSEGHAVAIGPEGGWSPRELDAMLAADWAPLGLGGWVLRADTAVAVAVASLAAER